ncbi:unnamed protein product [Paramecium octaurelia]|uniref:Uncharacterized protein n=1 Tax=Paramecium octaurelia TaxID=43137 RepID=A0A8S1VMI6_PAROT|nr:unnamed protein product [Paramecium octaurelia]
MIVQTSLHHLYFSEIFRKFFEFISDQIYLKFQLKDCFYCFNYFELLNEVNLRYNNYSQEAFQVDDLGECLIGDYRVIILINGFRLNMLIKRDMQLDISGQFLSHKVDIEKLVGYCESFCRNLLDLNQIAIQIIRAIYCRIVDQDQTIILAMLEITLG